MSQKRVEVKIKDMKFYVVGGEDPSYIKNLATELNERITNIEKSNYKLNQLESTILTALNILDDLQKEKKSKAEMGKISQDKAQALEKVEEISKLKEEISKLRGVNKQSNDEILDLRKKFNKTNEELKEKSSDNFKKNDKIKILNEDISNLRKENNNLKNQNQQAQKKIIDLSRELESLYDEK